MFFRNLIMFRFPVSATAHWFDHREVSAGASFSIEEPPAEALLADCRLKPVGPLELASRGFVPPMGGDNPQLAHRIGDAVWLAVGGENKILPASVVNSELAKRVAAIEEREGRKPGARARKRIKDDLLHELLPKAFVKPSRVDAFIDLRRGIIAVDTSSRRTAENVVSEVRRALGSFPALPLNAEVAPRAVLTGWLGGAPLPDGLWLGEDCELRDAVDGGAVIRCKDTDLRSDEIGGHLKAGLQCSRLALTMDDCVSFVLGEDLTLRRVKFLDGAMDRLDNVDADDLQAELDARFTLMAGEVGRLVDVLEPALQLSKAVAA